MASFWNKITNKFLSGQHNPAPVKPAIPEPEASNLPDTSQPNAGGRIQVFDPALLQYGFTRAFRLTDPVFSSTEERVAWHACRRQVIDHLLQIAAASQWKDYLVLRGSLLLKAWLGDAAREPGDIDWVVMPKEIALTDSLAKELLNGLVAMISSQPVAGNVIIDAGNISMDDIWTYERAQGRRIVLPWRYGNLPTGTVQIDIVFGEELWSAPVWMDIPLLTGGRISTWGATMELSLAWKLAWLESDITPQAKDLYDAMLLAERPQVQLSLELLDRALVGNGARSIYELPDDFILKWEVDSEEFKLEYPWVEGDANDWKNRLATALRLEPMCWQDLNR